MNILQVILLGILQGITEFLPVSSTGHAAVLQQLLQTETGGGLFLPILLHVGTLSGIIAVFSRDLRRTALDGAGIIYDTYGNIRIWLRNKNESSNEAYKRVLSTNYRKFAALIALSAVPTVLLGFFSRHMADAAMNNLLAPGIGFLITGIFLLVTDFVNQGKKIPKDTTYANAMWIGICQGIAVLPGISRLGVTLAACMLCGFNRKYAVKYSFIMSVPVILGALILELFQVGSLDMTWGMAGACFLGMLAAAVTGFFTARILIGFVQKSKFRYFAAYSFLIGLVAIIGNYAIL